MSLEQLRGQLRTKEPTRPSRLLSSLDYRHLDRISNCRGIISVKLISQIKEDLDWIAMQCLEKDPSRRYQAVTELIAELSRYLRHESVLARPPTLLYTARKLARRNRVAFASALVAATFVVFITGFAITMTIQAQRIATERDHAKREREQAQRVSNVALNVFGIADPFQNFASNVSGTSLLEEAAKSIERELADQPVARARLLQALGRAHTRRGEFKHSVPYLKEAVRVLSQSHGSESEALVALIDLSLALRLTGDFSGARKALANGEHLVKQQGMEKSVAYARLLLNQGRIDLDEGYIREARLEFERSLTLYRDLVGNQSSEVAEVLCDLAASFTWTDDHAGAERLAREAIEIYERTLPSMHPDRVRADAMLAEALYLQQRADEAAPLLLNVLRKETTLFGHNSPQAADVLDRLAITRYAQGSLEDAERFSRQALAASRIAFGEKHASTANVAVTLARTLTALGKHTEADATLRQALEVFAATLPDDHQCIATAEYFLGEVLLATKRLSEAEAVLTASMNRWERSGAPHWRAMRSANALGEALYRQGRTKEGVRYLSESLRDLADDPNAEAAAKDKARERASRYLPESLRSQKIPPKPLTLAKQ